MEQERIDSFITIRWLISAVAHENSHKMMYLIDSIMKDEFNEELKTMTTTEEFFAWIDVLDPIFEIWKLKMKKSHNIAWQFEIVDNETISYKISNHSSGQTSVKNIYRNMYLSL